VNQSRGRRLACNASNLLAPSTENSSAFAASVQADRGSAGERPPRSAASARNRLMQQRRKPPSRYCKSQRPKARGCARAFAPVRRNGAPVATMPAAFTRCRTRRAQSEIDPSLGVGQQGSVAVGGDHARGVRCVEAMAFPRRLPETGVGARVAFARWAGGGCGSAATRSNAQDARNLATRDCRDR
jgi:hypothetical protein